ncbi:MAG: Chromate resistance protein ChrB, partial [Bacillota bacterium]
KKLAAWLRKIQARDFFGGEQAKEAASALAHCYEALRGFADAVYPREGFQLLSRNDDDKTE